MEALFIKLLNMSITASYLVLAVVLLRLLLKKAPKAIFVAMWALVGLRLMVPFSLESIFSLIPSAEPVPEDIAYVPIPTVQTGVQFFNSAVNPVLQHSFAPAPGASVNPMQIVLRIASTLWAVGVAVMLGYCAFSYLRIHRKVREAACLKGRIWLCDSISSPFILGLFRPKIYLPSNMNEQDMEYVLAHENAHLKRRDHLWKPLGFLLLAVYWFNPLMWLAYILLCRDIELACDEKVMKQMGSEAKKPYSEALLNCSVKPRMIAACPLAFGEVGVKKRIKGILNYKKPAFWILLVALILCVLAAVFFLTNPKSNAEQLSTKPGITTAPPHTHPLGQEYPEYFGLSTDNGLTVYIYEKKDGSYGCQLKETGNTSMAGGELTTIHEMWTILINAYGLPPEEITVIPGIIAYSSVRPDFDNLDDYNQRAKEAFWFPYYDLDEIEKRQVKDAAVFDIDNDGIDEEVQLRLGPTSGVNTIAITVLEDGKREYFGTIQTDWDHFEFQRDENGKVYLHLYGTKFEHIPEDEWMELSAEDVHVIFTPTQKYNAVHYENYSQYFGLDASGGLDVYVWQMAKGSYSFGVLPHSEEKLDWMSPQLMNMPGATAYEMRQILSSYGLDESAVYIIPWQNPLSSYIGDLWIVDSNMTAEQRQAKYDAYIAEIKEMLFGVPIDGLLMDSPIYDKIVFDVDGDGQDESCVLSYGRTSGLFTFGFRAYDYNAGVEKYNNVFLTQWYDLSFVKGDDGVVRVKAVDQADPPQTHYFDIVIENGNVSLRENGETEITGLIQVYYKPYPLLFVDTSSENTNAYVLCGFAPGRMYSTEDYLYNGRKLSEYIREQDVAVSSNILDRNKTLSFCDVNGKRFETATDGLRCTGRMIDETVEVQAKLSQIPNQKSCYLGTYCGIPIFPESITYGNRSISADLNTDGNPDTIFWEFAPADPDLYGEHFHYTVTATIGTQAYTIESNSQLPCKEEDVQIFVADVDLDGNYELIIYSKGMSRFRTISIYQLGTDSVNQLLYYIINPEP